MSRPKRPTTIDLSKVSDYLAEIHWKLNPGVRHGDESPAEVAFDDTVLRVLDKRRQYFLGLDPYTPDG